MARQNVAKPNASTSKGLALVLRTFEELQQPMPADELAQLQRALDAPRAPRQPELALSLERKDR